MEERVFGLSDVDERRLQSRFEVLDFPLENRPDHAFVAVALDFEFLHHALDKQRDAFFERLYVDYDFAVGFVFAFEKSDDFFEKRTLFCAQLRLLIKLFFGNRLDDLLRGTLCQIIVLVFLFHGFALILD